METDRLVDDYLGRLEEAAAHLQRSRRSELIAEIREHIEAALREEEAAGEVAVRNVLERLGPPEEIVEAAEPPPEADQVPTGKLEVAAMVTLVVPFIGWLFGIAMVLISRAWLNREKTVATALALLPALAFLTLALFDSYSESTSSTLEVLLFVLWVIGGLPAALYLGVAAAAELIRRRATPSIVARPEASLGLPSGRTARPSWVSPRSRIATWSQRCRSPGVRGPPGDRREKRDRERRQRPRSNPPECEGNRSHDWPDPRLTSGSPRRRTIVHHSTLLGVARSWRLALGPPASPQRSRISLAYPGHRARRPIS
jgi:hypothetical protein